jgi:peptidyl-prolyl cis-trans isomerase C
MKEITICARNFSGCMPILYFNLRMKSTITSARAILVAGSLVLPLSIFAADPAAPAAPPTSAAESQPIELKDPVAVVNGEEISKADLEKAFAEAVGAAGVEAGMLSAEQRIAGYRQLVDDMITDKLVAKKAESIEVTDDDVKVELDKIKSQFPSPEVFEEQLKQSGQTPDQLGEMVKAGMKQRKWIESQIAGKDAVVEADAKKFYDENTEEFSQPEQVQASHILFLVPEDATPEVVKEKEDAAKAALERANKGEDFAALAKELSEEPGADQSGGDLGLFTKDRMVPEFADAAFSQEKDAIGGPVKTDFGFHIIKVTDKKPAGTMSFDEVKEQLMSFLQNNKRQEAVRSIVEGLRSDSKIEVNLPKPAPSVEEPAPAAN